MSAIVDTPQNLSFLPQTGFQFFLKRAPHLNFFMQHVEIPGVELGAATISSPLVDVHVPGEHMSFDELEVSFIVDEDLANYLEVHNWLRTLGRPEQMDQRAALNDDKPGIDMVNGVYSDLTILIRNAKRNATFEVVFSDAFPTALSKIEFDSVDNDVQYIWASARFTYTTYIINRLSAPTA